MRDALLREQKYYSGFNLPPPTRDALLWGYEDYTITGPIDDSEDVEGIGMIDGMSLGLATPFVIPMLNDQIAREKVHVRTIRVWYDAHLHYYAHQMLYDSAWKDRPPGADLSFAKAIWF